MTVFTKPTKEITYEDVVEFCKKGQVEGFFLDYKANFPQPSEKLAKTIAAFANTWGGVLLIGVNEKDLKPVSPFEGIVYYEKLHEQVENIVYDHIKPPVFIDIRVASNEDKTKAFIVIRVPQSNNAHILNDGAIYIRTDSSSRPEEVASPEQIEWLMDRRGKSINLRKSIYSKAEERFLNYCRLHEIIEQNIPGLCSISIMPLYPQKPLINYWEILNIAVQMTVFSSYLHDDYPFNISGAKKVQGGISCFALTENQFEHFWELNNFGLLLHKEQVVMKEEDMRLVVGLPKIVALICLILKASLNFYRRVGYWGLLEFRLKIENISGTSPGLHALGSFVRSHPVRVTDKELFWQREFSFKELEDNSKDIIVEILHDVFWSMGVKGEETYVRDLVRKLEPGIMSK